MKFDVYCDEAFPDLLTSQNPNADYLMIGSLWLPSDLRAQAKERIAELREKHSVWGEIKWTKVSPSKIDFYLDLVDMFFGFGDAMRFRCIAVNHANVNMAHHEDDHELGFYKFYYQVLHHWILHNNTYRIFCDMKSNRDPQRFGKLRKVLSNANLDAEVECVQALPSREVVLIQLADLLLGAAGSRLNRTLRVGSAKEAVVHKIEERLGRQIAPTWQNERKFNVFKINLRGGW
ncbi:hypothetical protein RA28_19680 [Ruegeria sp. ANG-S4]|uniref:DUF3800 domain-containing protein n=1 Tax=Ruegeria sp. ANG-S4 TaxID=1577904 RepID=UPI00057C649D|nr:DUF3800 domain-containing protein [Ruegeria sp. ANG-S4]KIC43848.1 hypothetical protein RA28_19680 [Ruegeria sp. ANG-S4]